MALWEFDHIVRSLYRLDYIESPALRQNFHRALNRGEAYHRLRRAIAYAHGGRFRVCSQQEQELWNACSRLIASAVIHYDSIVMSEVLKSLEKHKENTAIEVLHHVSPMAWQHVNFYGRYRFDSDLRPLDLTAMANQLRENRTDLWQPKAR